MHLRATGRDLGDVRRGNDAFFLQASPACMEEGRICWFSMHEKNLDMRRCGWWCSGSDDGAEGSSARKRLCPEG